MKFKLSVIIASLTLCSCADGRLYNQNNGSFAPNNYGNDLIKSSIETKEDKLSDEEIIKSLEYKYSFKGIKRVAFLPIGTNGTDLIGYQNDLVKEAESSVPGIEVRKIPSILLPNMPSIENLRRLSVKMQVDTLIIFNSYTNNKYKNNYISKDKYKTALSIDYYIFDVRSGLIPYSNSVDKVSEYTDGTIDYEKMEEMRRQDLFQCIRMMIDQIAKKILSDK